MISSIRDSFLRVYLRTPEHPAKYRIVRFLSRHVCPTEGLRAKVYPNLSLTLHPRDWIEYLLLRGRPYEPLTLDFLSANLKAGDVAVLAGASFGLHVAVAARAVGDGGLVVGIEPQPAALLRARATLRGNLLEARVKLVGAALGAERGLIPMAWSSDDNAAAASLLDNGPGMMAAVVPLSSIFSDLCPQTPRLLLLDVEGFEARVLEGMGNSHRPEVIVIEIYPEGLQRAGTTAEAVFRTLRGLGYELFDLEGSNAGLPDAPIPESNLICVLSGSVAHWSKRAKTAQSIQSPTHG